MREAWRAHKGNAEKQALAMRLVSRAMSAWMQGSLRGCFFDMREAWRAHKGNAEKQALAMRLVSRAVSAWMQGSLRGCFFDMRYNCSDESKTTVAARSKAAGLDLLDRTLFQWMQGSTRGCFNCVKENFRHQQQQLAVKVANEQAREKQKMKHDAAQNLKKANANASAQAAELQKMNEDLEMQLSEALAELATAEKALMKLQNTTDEKIKVLSQQVLELDRRANWLQARLDERKYGLLVKWERQDYYDPENWEALEQSISDQIEIDYFAGCEESLINMPDGSSMRTFMNARTASHAKVAGGKPTKLRRLQPLVAYVEVTIPEYIGRDLIPTDEWAQRLDKKSLPSDVYRTGI